MTLPAKGATDWGTTLNTHINIEHNADGTHDIYTAGEGGYSTVDVNSVKTKVYTKYLTGTLDADSSTSVAHGVTTGLTKILSVTVACYQDNSAVNVGADFALGLSATSSFQFTWDGTNILIDNVGSFVQGNSYRIRIDYIL